MKAGEDSADLRGQKTPKKVRTGDRITADAAAIEDNYQANIKDLAQAHGATYGTVSRIIHDSLLYLVAGEWFLLWDNTLVNTAKTLRNFLAKNNIQLLSSTLLTERRWLLPLPQV